MSKSKHLPFSYVSPFVSLPVSVRPTIVLSMCYSSPVSLKYDIPSVSLFLITLLVQFITLLLKLQHTNPSSHILPTFHRMSKSTTTHNSQSLLSAAFACGMYTHKASTTKKRFFIIVCLKVNVRYDIPVTAGVTRFFRCNQLVVALPANSSCIAA